MFCDFFNQNLKASISWPGFAVRLSLCPEGELARPLPCACEFALSYFHFVSPSLWLLFVVCYLYLCLLCFPFLRFLFLANTIRRQSLSSSSAAAAGCRALLGNPWMMIFPKLNQSEIESNLLSSSFCASDYATQISFARVP